LSNISPHPRHVCDDLAFVRLQMSQLVRTLLDVRGEGTVMQLMVIVCVLLNVQLARLVLCLSQDLVIVVRLSEQLLSQLIGEGNMLIFFVLLEVEAGVQLRVDRLLVAVLVPVLVQLLLHIVGLVLLCSVVVNALLVSVRFALVQELKL